MVRVLYNWGDEDCLRILRACHAGMEKNVRLLIGNRLLEPDPARAHRGAYQTDMQMMAMFGGARERTEAEFSDLLSASGFVPRRCIATSSPTSIIEAVPA